MEHVESCLTKRTCNGTYERRAGSGLFDLTLD